VKKILYEHLRQQLSQTRQEWADAYDEHVKLDEQKKDQLDKRFAELRDLQKRIDEIELIVKRHVREMDFE
jgi:hypothetical protein